MKTIAANHHISKYAPKVITLLLSALLLAQVTKILNTTFSSQGSLSEKENQTTPTVKQSGAIRTLFGAPHHVENQNSVKINGAISITGKDNTSAAILSIDNKPPRIFRIGQELAPKQKLIAVTPEFIIIENDGMQEKIKIPAKKSINNQNPEAVASENH